MENNNRDIIALGRLGKLHKERGEIHKCVEHWRWLAVVIAEEGTSSSELPEEYLEFLAEYCILKMKDGEKGKGDGDKASYRVEAEKYCKMMMNSQSTEKRGEALLARLSEGSVV